MTNIVDWAESKFGFYVDRHFINGKWVLKQAPIQLSDYHKRILQHIFSPDENGRWPYDTVAWCEPAKSGKSAIAGLVSKYVALHGEKNSSVIMASNKKDQAASLMFKSLTDSIEYNPHLPNVDTGKYEVTFSNGNQVKAIPSNSKGEAGARFSLALFDELWAYVYEDSLRLWSEFKSDPTRQNSLKFAIGYAGYIGESELWLNLLETGLQGQPIPELSDITNQDGSPTCYANGRLFVFWSHVPRQPWQTQTWLNSQAVSLSPSEFRRMIQTEFIASSEASFTQEEWFDSCYNPLVKPIVAGDTTPLVIALDLSLGTMGGDTISLVGVSKWGDNGYAVKFVRSYSPINGERFDYDQTAGIDLNWLINNCSIAQLPYDVYQAAHFIKQFSHLVWCEEFSQQTERTIADKFLYDLIVARRLHHDGNPLLRQHILNAGSKHAEDGKLRLVKTHPRKKIDLAVCLSMACYRASKLNLPPDPASENDRIKRLVELEDISPPPITPQPVVNEKIKLLYDGGMFGIPLNGQTIERGAIVEVTRQQAEYLQGHYPADWWVKL